MDHEPDDIERLRRLQADRARQEAELADSAADAEEQRAHERRSEKAEYLHRKLDEQADS